MFCVFRMKMYESEKGLVLLLGQFLVASGWRRRRVLVEVSPVDVQPKGNVQRDDRSNSRVDVTGDLRQREEFVAEHVFATEERHHWETDNQNAVGESYTEVAGLIALFLGIGKKKDIEY